MFIEFYSDFKISGHADVMLRHLYPLSLNANFNLAMPIAVVFSIMLFVNPPLSKM